VTFLQKCLINEKEVIQVVKYGRIIKSLLHTNFSARANGIVMLEKEVFCVKDEYEYL
jgi:hypothetical protein